MLQRVIDILNKFDYRIGYSPYHTDADIKKYASRKDAVSGEKFLTVYSPEGYVVGRVHGVGENTRFQVSHLQTIIDYFKTFEISHAPSIVLELEKIYPQAKKK